MKGISTGYIGNVVLNLFILILLIGVYSYLDKMEAMGCACSQHKNREFIKIFTIFAFVFLAAIIFIPPSFIGDTFGHTVAGIFVFVKFIFYIVCIVYFYMILDYTRFLINEKCKCSEDIRRELIMAGSIVEISLMVLVLLVIIILPVLFNSITFVIQNADEYDKNLTGAFRRPLKTIKSLPNNMKNTGKMFMKLKKNFKK